MYSLDSSSKICGNTTGICYHLVTGEEDLAVKIYYEGVDYPRQEEIEFFGKFSKEVVPVLISKYPVFDESRNYIGCAAPFIEETQGKAKDILYTMQSEKFLNGMIEIQEKLFVFDRNGIFLSDWGIHNLMIGKGQQIPFGIYLVDDSYYMRVDFDVELHNQQVFYQLIRSIVGHYLRKKGLFNCHMEEEEETFLNDFLEALTLSNPFFCTIPKLEKEMTGYNNLQEYLDDYIEIKQKKQKF